MHVVIANMLAQIKSRCSFPLTSIRKSCLGLLVSRTLSFFAMQTVHNVGDVALCSTMGWIVLKPQDHTTHHTWHMNDIQTKLVNNEFPIVVQVATWRYRHLFIEVKALRCHDDDGLTHYNWLL